MLIFWEIPIAATASEPNTEVKLFSTVMLVTFSRFWMEEGMPTPQMPATTAGFALAIAGRRQT